MPSTSFVMLIGHMSIGKTMSYLSNENSTLTISVAIRTFFGESDLLKKFAKDEEYNGAESKTKPKTKLSVPSGKFPITGGSDGKNLSSFFSGEGNRISKVKKGDVIGVLGHTGINRTSNPKKWGSHAHITTYPCNVTSDWNKVTNIKGSRGVVLSSQSTVEETAKVTDDPLFVLSTPEEFFPANVYTSASRDEDWSARVTRAIGGVSGDPSRALTKTPEDVVEHIATIKAYETILFSLAGVDVPPINLPYFDSYFVDGGFPFALVYKDDLIITSLVSHTMNCGGQGRASSSLALARGISVRKMVSLMLSIMSDESQIRFFNAHPDLFMFPAHSMPFYNQTLLSVNAMNAEYESLFGKSDFVFDWRKAVLIDYGAVETTMFQLMTDKEFRNQVLDDSNISSYRSIKIDLQLIFPSFETKGEESLLIDDRAWSASHRYTLNDAKDVAFNPKSEEECVTGFNPDSEEVYEDQTTALWNKTGDSSVEDSPLLFYDLKNLFTYLKKYIR